MSCHNLTITFKNIINGENNMMVGQNLGYSNIFRNLYIAFLLHALIITLICILEPGDMVSPMIPVGSSCSSDYFGLGNSNRVKLNCLLLYRKTHSSFDSINMHSKKSVYL